MQANEKEPEKFCALLQQYLWLLLLNMLWSFTLLDIVPG